MYSPISSTAPSHPRRRTAHAPSPSSADGAGARGAASRTLDGPARTLDASRTLRSTGIRSKAPRAKCDMCGVCRSGPDTKDDALPTDRRRSADVDQTAGSDSKAHVHIRIRLRSARLCPPGAHATAPPVVCGEPCGDWGARAVCSTRPVRSGPAWPPRTETAAPTKVGRFVACGDV